MSDIFIWITLLFVFIIIIGLYMASYTPPDLTEKEKILKLNTEIEGFTVERFTNPTKENFGIFNPSVSSDMSISEGAQRYYNWGAPKTTYQNNIIESENNNTSSTNTQCLNLPTQQNNCVNNNNNNTNICRTCDITLNNDIDKYVLKSSVPACPDMSEYITKNMLPPVQDLSDYILKSEIEPCPKVDLSEYILKSSVPPCPDCPTCPECPICPICPTCPPEKECKEIYQYNINDHPDLNKYVLKSDIDKKYISKADVNKDYISKNNVNLLYVPKNQCIPQQQSNTTTTSVNKQHIIEEELDLKTRIKSKFQPVKKIFKDIGKNIKDEDDDFNKIFTKTPPPPVPKDADLLGDVKGFYAGDMNFMAF